ncbi:hypothetical protein TNCV_2332601 [Trichonephila clavipes]|nr:hypothetical protein TNCV_2332601 [Trichonephila clavipes]
MTLLPKTGAYGSPVVKFRFNRFEILEVLDGSLLDAVASDSDRETEGRISVDSAANLLEVVGNKRVSVFKDEDEVFKLLPVKEVVVEVRMGIGNKASFCIVGNIADVEGGMVMEGRSLDTGILGICGWDFDIVEVERNRCA